METSQSAWMEGRSRRLMTAALLVVDLVHSCFLISRTRHNVLIIYGDVTAQHWGRLLWLRREWKTCEQSDKCALGCERKESRGMKAMCVTNRCWPEDLMWFISSCSPQYHHNKSAVQLCLFFPSPSWRLYAQMFASLIHNIVPEWELNVWLHFYFYHFWFPLSLLSITDHLTFFLFITSSHKQSASRKVFHFFLKDISIQSVTSLPIKTVLCLASQLPITGTFFHTYLEYAGSIRGSPCVEQIVFSCTHKPLPCRGRQTTLGHTKTKYLPQTCCIKQPYLIHIAP